MRLAANLSFFFKELPFLRRFGAARTAGFRAVEFMFAGDGGYIADAAHVRAELEQHGLTQVLLNAPAGNWAVGERGLGGLPGREAEWKASIEFGLRFASEVSCPRMHVMAGLVADGAEEDTFVSRLQWASGLAADAGVTLCVEPLNSHDFPGYLVPDTTTALRILQKVDAPNHCRLQLDLYHLAMADREMDLAASIRDLLPHAAHVQIANPPGRYLPPAPPTPTACMGIELCAVLAANTLAPLCLASRNEPGVGAIDFPPLFALLDDLGYDGHVGCEYKPSTPTTEASLGWARQYGLP